MHNRPGIGRRELQIFWVLWHCGARYPRFALMPAADGMRACLASSVQRSVERADQRRRVLRSRIVDDFSANSIGSIPPAPDIDLISSHTNMFVERNKPVFAGLLNWSTPRRGPRIAGRKGIARVDQLTLSKVGGYRWVFRLETATILVAVAIITQARSISD